MTELEPESYDQNLELRKQYIDLMAKAWTDFDKTLLAISGGSLGLSLTFVEKIVPMDRATDVWMLVASWLFLGSAMLLALFSHYASAHATEALIDRIHEDMGLPEPERSINKKALDWSAMTRWANRIAMTGTMIGVALAVTFCAINTSERAEGQRRKGDNSSEAATAKAKDRDRNAATSTASDSSD